LGDRRATEETGSEGGGASGVLGPAGSCLGGKGGEVGFLGRSSIEKKGLTSDGSNTEFSEPSTSFFGECFCLLCRSLLIVDFFLLLHKQLDIRGN
jgi:hypothetical protein